MSFGWPLALLALLLVPLAAAGYVLAQRRRIRYAARFTNLDLLANVVERSPGWRRHLPPALALLSLAALVVALARPQTTLAVARDQATVVLAMDVSRSMEATDVEPTRLAAAKDAAERLLDVLPEGTKVGVVAFSSEAQVVTAATDDHEVVQEAIESLQTLGGTALGEAISRAVEVGQDSTATDADPGTGEQAPFSILLLSDGASSIGPEPLDTVSEAQAAGVPVYTIALGTDGGTVDTVDELGNPVTVAVPPDEETLAQIAELTGAQTFDAPSEDQLRAVYEEIGSQVGYDEEKREVTYAFAAAGAVFLLAGASLSTLWFNRIP
jgi:Ca-activated chloride channel family protein